MLWVFADAGVKVAPALVLIAFALAGRRSNDLALIPLVGSLYIADFALLRFPAWLPEAAVFDGQWNWDGKVVSVLFGLASLGLLPPGLRESVGLFAPPTRRAWVPVFLIAVFYCAWAASTARFGVPPFDAETVSYQATLPGIDEELSFRGVWWVLLAASLDPGRIEAGRIPWVTLVIVTLWFGWVHAAGVDAAGAVFVDWDKFQGPAIGGFVFGLLQGLGRSLWVPIAVHNLSNTLRYL